MDKFNVVVIGGGPSGMMAAIRASQLAEKIILIEKNDSLGRKLLISGKGRCNLTNIAELDDFLAHFGRSGDFLRSAFGHFFNTQLTQFFEKNGLKLKVERGGRVFPEDDSSNSVLDILKKNIKRQRIQVSLKTKVQEIKLNQDNLKEIIFDDGYRLIAAKVILATGGLSYPATGSTGDGYRIAKNLGHKIVSLRAGLVSLVTKETWIKDLAGLSLKNVRIKILSDKKTIQSDIGEMMFTHFGVSGPLALDLSSKVVDLLDQDKSVILSIDLKPALTEKQLEARLLRDITDKGATFYKNLLKGLLPNKLIKVFVDLSRINPERRANQITQQERINIIRLLKDFRLTVNKARSIKEAIITRGGISTREINPKTMESNIVEGLYLCGEIIDVDADTGGYNLQAAFSTGYLAGESAAKSLNQ